MVINNLARTMKTLLAIVSATAITHIGYRIVDFTPTSKFSLWPGLLVDFAIWMVVYLVCVFMIGVAAKRLRK